jgi:NAD-dependent dihydropyrimidine dehydrogenase PreA subunit
MKDPLDTIIFCPDGGHEWEKVKGGAVLDTFGMVLKMCTKCGQYSDWHWVEGE